MHKRLMPTTFTGDAVSAGAAPAMDRSRSTQAVGGKEARREGGDTLSRPPTAWSLGVGMATQWRRPAVARR
ncbi:hypothetical protein GUJ93_ZPchr0010g10474 [Zizania palustris]|uniref:Uncharacterized protein n=1 Tax=Zizania palustris TaxID=103762 RepID=A0A8J5WEM7_ZIZPA|nr:hypothetical protein GUJ93_ZPchr0010g10474 [Zizania palustris]